MAPAVGLASRGNPAPAARRRAPARRTEGPRPANPPRQGPLPHHHSHHPRRLLPTELGQPRAVVAIIAHPTVRRTAIFVVTSTATMEPRRPNACGSSHTPRLCGDRRRLTVLTRLEPLPVGV